MSTLQNRPTPKSLMPPAAPTLKAKRKIIYPDSDGKRMADNTLQADIIIWLKTNFDDLFAADPEVFVAMDLLWYPVEGDNKTRTAPDTLIAFGARKGYRGSYKQWEEGFPPQVVFEVLSPGNQAGGMKRKLAFYELLGVQEYYVYNPYKFGLTGYLRDAVTGLLTPIAPIDGFVSPRLGVRFEAPGNRELAIYQADGSRFKTPTEIRDELKRAEAEKAFLAIERDGALSEREQAEKQRDQVAKERDQAAQKNALLAAKLRELGIDPETIL